MITQIDSQFIIYGCHYNALIILGLNQDFREKDPFFSGSSKWCLPFVKKGAKFNYHPQAERGQPN